MSGFAALMALSASQTKQVQSAVQTALEQRQRNEELRRKKQEEEERKLRQEEAKLRQKRFEDQKRQQELEARREAERARLAVEQTRREEEARNALLYGPKKKHGPKWPMSQSAAKDDVRRRRGGGDDDSRSRSESPAIALTREEKRQRRVEAEMRRMYQLKRASSAGYNKFGRRLPGGAIDAPSAPASDTGASTQSVKARLTALPNTLTKLNVNKRDTRTIDEILHDRAKAKNMTLDGDEAREFNDWFGKAKKKEPPPPPCTHSSSSLASGSSSGGNSPRQTGTRTPSQPPAKAQPSVANGRTSSNLSSTRPPSSPQSRPALSAKSSMSMIPKHSLAVRPSHSKSPVPKSHTTKSGSTSVGAPRSGRMPLKKRPRSPSLSLSPPPSSKRRVLEPGNTLGSEIWKLFGKDRNTYVGRDVLSDDEDMEVDASVVMKEEMRSARLARREDEIALEEEKRHEEEKRKRKREREREIRERQGI